jgi:hypothetical protein
MMIYNAQKTASVGYSGDSKSSFWLQWNLEFPLLLPAENPRKILEYETKVEILLASKSRPHME